MFDYFSPIRRMLGAKLLFLMFALPLYAFSQNAPERKSDSIAAIGKLLSIIDTDSAYIDSDKISEIYYRTGHFLHDGDLKTRYLMQSAKGIFVLNGGAAGVDLLNASLSEAVKIRKAAITQDRVPASRKAAIEAFKESPNAVLDLLSNSPCTIGSDLKLIDGDGALMMPALESDTYMVSSIALQLYSSNPGKALSILIDRLRTCDDASFDGIQTMQSGIAGNTEGLRKLKEALYERTSRILQGDSYVMGNVLLSAQLDSMGIEDKQAYLDLASRSLRLHDISKLGRLSRALISLSCTNYDKSIPDTGSSDLEGYKAIFVKCVNDIGLTNLTKDDADMASSLIHARENYPGFLWSVADKWEDGENSEHTFAEFHRISNMLNKTLSTVRSEYMKSNIETRILLISQICALSSSDDCVKEINNITEGIGSVTSLKNRYIDYITLYLMLPDGYSDSRKLLKEKILATTRQVFNDSSQRGSAEEYIAYTGIILINAMMESDGIDSVILYIESQPSPYLRAEFASLVFEYKYDYSRIGEERN